MAWAATIIGGISAAFSIGMGGAQAAGAFNPTQPDLASSSEGLSNINARMLPVQRQLQALAQSGGKGTIFMPPTVKTGQIVQPPGGGPMVQYVASEWIPGGKYNKDGKAQPHPQDGAYLSGGYKTYDFSGLGAADVQAKLAKDMAQIQLDLGKKYDSQYIDEALKQEKLADPQGFAARDRMSELIQEQNNRPVNAPVADTLNRQVQEELDAAKTHTLDPQMHAMLMQGGAAALAARGGGSDTNQADFEKPLVTGSAGTRRELAATGKATNWLSSGESPDDIAYRREQQNLSNLSALTNGQTPQTQFKTLSGAQQGPTPVVTGQPLPTLANNGASAQNSAISAFQTQQGAAASQADPWMAGLSALLGVGKTAANLGWQPLK